MITSNTPRFQPLLDPSAMRLAMGELSPSEVALAQSAVTRALRMMEESGWVFLARDPDPDTLMRMARRADLLESSRQAYQCLLQFTPSSFTLRPLIKQIQDEAVEAMKVDQDQALVVRSAVRYAVTNLPKHGLVMVPLLPTDQVIDHLSDFLKKHEQAAISDPSARLEDWDRSYRLEAYRLHMEAVVDPDSVSPGRPGPRV